MAYGLEIGEEYEDYSDLVEEMLGQDYVGEDLEMVGAARPLYGRRPITRRGVPRGGLRRMRAPVSNALAARRVQDAVVLKKTAPTKGRSLFMGLDSGAVLIAAGATGNVTDRPQKLFRPERLAVPASIAAMFILNSLNIGTVNQFVSNTAVPCETFQEGGVGVGLRGDTAHPGLDITASVTNISGGALRFRATLFGSSVE